MAEGKKDVYPQMPTKWWWDLREQFKRVMPSGKVTDSYLASVLNLQISSAKSVAIPAFKLLGIINSDGTLNDNRARVWRDNEQYSLVCQEIVQELYPQELRDAFPEPSEDNRNSVRQWFARKTGVGDRAANKMTTFYLMLNEANPSIQPKPSKPKARRVPEERAKRKEKLEAKVTPDMKSSEANSIIPRELKEPSLNINIEIHISSDASETQIDKIFESMAKHLNIGRKKGDE